MACRMVVEGELATLRFALEGAEEFPEELREELADELTDIACDKLGSLGATVTLTWDPDSLEIAALIECEELVADTGAFFSGLRELRRLVPSRVRERINERLPLPVTLGPARLEAETGLLHGKAEDKDASKTAAAEAVSVRELAWYAGLSLAVLVIVGLLVILGVSAFI
jgi:hypothetical protein